MPELKVFKSKSLKLMKLLLLYVKLRVIRSRFRAMICSVVNNAALSDAWCIGQYERMSLIV